jgi:RNA polymerase sigma factor (sigma-70 family)
MDEFAASSYRREYGRVYRFVRRRGGSGQDAEDLMQEVFEAALAAFADQRLVGDPSLPWLYTVAERRLIAAWRRSQKTDPLDPDSTPTPEGAESYGGRVSAALLAGLNRVPSGRREVVVLKLFRATQPASPRRPASPVPMSGGYADSPPTPSAA